MPSHGLLRVVNSATLVTKCRASGNDIGGMNVSETKAWPSWGPKLQTADYRTDTLSATLKSRVGRIPEGDFMPEGEDSVLQHAGIILDAVALSQAVLDGDLAEARFRASLVASHANEAGLAIVEKAAVDVMVILSPAKGLSAVGIGPAIERLSIAIDEAQEFG